MRVHLSTLSLRLTFDKLRFAQRLRSGHSTPLPGWHTMSEAEGVKRLRRSRMVGQVGIEPTTNRLCSYYCFHNPFQVCKPDYTFTPMSIGGLSSSLYTLSGVFPNLGSGLPCPFKMDLGFPEFDRFSFRNCFLNSPVKNFRIMLLFSYEINHNV